MINFYISISNPVTSVISQGLISFLVGVSLPQVIILVVTVSLERD